MISIKNKGVFQMNPLDRKKALREQFEKNKKMKGTQHKEIISFSKFGIKVNTDLLKEYRDERGGADK